MTLKRALAVGLLGAFIAPQALAKGSKAGKESGAAADPADPEAEVAKAFGGKVWVQREPIGASSPDGLRQWLAANPAVQEIVRKGKDGPWTINFVAVFKKPAVKGPLTIQFFEKGSPRELVDQYSTEDEVSSSVYRSSYELSDDKGFNKNHSYTMRVGQILKGKFVPYAAGEMTLR